MNLRPSPFALICAYPRKSASQVIVSARSPSRSIFKFKAFKALEAFCGALILTEHNSK